LTARELTALVIGNATYQNADLLKNSVNDAVDVSQALENLGFYVIKLTDATTEDMDRALEIFGQKLENSDVGLFFFAGHAFQIEGFNFLAGIDTKADTKMNVQYSSLHLDKVIGTMRQAAVATSIVILDACRNNPFDLVVYRSGDPRELAPINAPRGTLIAYSTSPGQKSKDGSSANGSYTEALLQHIATEDIPIETMFKRVRSTLEAITGETQTSWEHTSLIGDFRFRLKASAPVLGYTRTALADSFFVLHNKNPGHMLIRALKSYSWHTQNPALEAFNADETEFLNDDDLFVLGRNLYQAACGNSRAAQAFIANFILKTERIEAKRRKSILDGMLFEIFFDSEGQRRLKPKTQNFEEVFRLQNFPDLASSFEFLISCLRPYAEHYYVIPGTNSEVGIDVIAAPSPLKGDDYFVSEIWFGSMNILHQENDLNPIFFSRDRKLNLEDFKEFLSTEMIVPKRLLAITFSFKKTSNICLIINGALTVRKDL
jgi:hypothetical protein